MLWQLRAFRFDESTNFSACFIKENPDELEAWFHQTSFFVERYLERVEHILPTRLADESYRNIINFERAFMQKTSINDMQKALVSF